MAADLNTGKIRILLDESLIEELNGWLTVNNGEIVRVEKPRKKKSTPGKLALQRIIFTTRLQTDIIPLFAMYMPK